VVEKGGEGGDVCISFQGQNSVIETRFELEAARAREKQLLAEMSVLKERLQGAEASTLGVQKERDELWEQVAASRRALAAANEELLKVEEVGRFLESVNLELMCQVREFERQREQWEGGGQSVKRPQSESRWRSMGEALRDWGDGHGGAGGEQQEQEDMQAQPRRRAGQSGCQSVEAYVRRIADALPPPLDALVQGVLLEVAGCSTLARQRDGAQEEGADDAAVPDVSWLGGAEEGEEDKRGEERGDEYGRGGGAAWRRRLASRSFRAAQLVMEGHFLLTLTAILMDNRQFTVIFLPLSPEGLEPSTLAHLNASDL
jgi:hypothetical protein